MKVKRYGSVTCGITEIVSGGLLRIEDVIKIIDYCLDDDQETEQRLRDLKEVLET